MNTTDSNVFLIRDICKQYRAFGFSASLHRFFGHVLPFQWYRRVKVALDHFYLACRAGEVVALLGHNGAGKTTAMNCITGLQKADQGDVRFRNYSVRSEHTKMNELTGVTSQHDVLFSGLNARDHIELYGGMRGIWPSQVWKVMEERLRDVKLHLVDRKNVEHYSGGMKRRLSFILSTIGDPAFLMLDEPTTGMDPVNRQHVWNAIGAYKTNHTVLLSTHAMEEADALGDRIAILRAGELVAIGSSNHLKSRFGSGYRLFMMTQPYQEGFIIDLVQHRLPTSILQLRDCGSAVFLVDDVPGLFAFLKTLPRDEEINSLILDWGISRASLVDVFHKLNSNVYTDSKKEI